MEPNRREGARWSVRLGEVCVELGAAAVEPRRRDQLRREAWEIIRTALTVFAREATRSLGPLGSEDIEDLASEKTLELLRRAESGAWGVHGRSGAEIAAFLRAAARHGVIDRLRAEGPRRRGGIAEARGAGPVDVFASIACDDSDPAVLSEATDFSDQLAACMAELKPRARSALLLRVFFDWSSEEIATHPDVGLPRAHVDVELQRARGRVRACMRLRGFELGSIPRGTFAILWGRFAGGRREREGE